MENRKVISIAIALLMITTIVEADTLVLKNGSKVECNIIKETDKSYIIEVDGGTVEFTKDEVQSISQGVFRKRQIKKVEEEQRVPESYVNRLGMSRDEVRQVLQREGREILEGLIKYDTLDMFSTGKERGNKLFGQNYLIHCFYTPITHRCHTISLDFSASSYRKLHGIIKEALIKKYGMPKQGDRINPVWISENTVISLSYGEGTRVLLSYSDMGLINKAEEEQQELDRDVIYKDIDRL